jgi:hypothetical protein
MKIIYSLKSTYRELGLLSGSVYLIDQAMQRLWPNSGICFYDWVVQPVTKDRLLPESRAARYRHQIVKGNDPLVEQMPILPEIVSKRIDQEAECVALFKGENLVAFIWLAYGSYIEDEVRIDFHLQPEEESAFDFNLYIFPKYRLGYAFAAIWDIANDYLYQRGIRYSYSRITHLKRNSFSSHSKLGAKKIGASLTLKLGKLELSVIQRPFRLFLSLRDTKRLQVMMKPEIGSRS